MSLEQEQKTDLQLDRSILGIMFHGNTIKYQLLCQHSTDIPVSILIERRLYKHTEVSVFSPENTDILHFYTKYSALSPKKMHAPILNNTVHIPAMWLFIITNNYNCLQTCGGKRMY